MTARRDEVGSVLMLVPAAVLVLVILGSIAVDSAVVFLAQRQLANRVAAAANDIAGVAVDDEGFYRGCELRLRGAEAERYLEVALNDRLPATGPIRGSVEVVGEVVEVSAQAEVRHVFARAIPGVHRASTVRASSRATALGADPGACVQ